MRGGSWRQRAAVLLAVLAAGLVCVGVTMQYASNTLLDSDRFASRTAAALDEPEMRSFLGRKIADGAIAGHPDLVAVRPLIESAASGVVASKPFRSIYYAAVRDLHRAVIERDEDAVVLVLADVGIVLRAAVAQLNPQAAAQIDATADAHVIEDELSAQIADGVRTLHDVRRVAGVLVLLAIAMAGGAAWLAADRRRISLIGGAALAGFALVALLLLGVARRAVLGEIGDAGARDAAQALWYSLFGDLRTILLLIAASGAVLAAAARSLLRAVSLERPLRELWLAVTTTPERTAPRIARAIALLAAGVIALVDPSVILDALLFGAGLLLVGTGVNELIRITSVPQEREPGRRPDAPGARGRSLLRRLAVAGALLGALVAVTAFLTVREGGVEVAAAAVDRCNGHRELCDRTLDEVALAGTHNAMSAATNPGWLFAQQDRGMDQQMKDGIRALLFDTHYGIPAGGSVKTDITPSAEERAKLEAELGTEAVEAALRIRDRIEGEETGPRGIYLCHALCELGALPIATALGQIRDFLASNPSEVLVIVVEDAVTPEDFVAAFRSAGLERYAYEGRVSPPWPTLRSMIQDDRRLVVFAEKQGTGAPWLRPAFDSIQETPYTFKKTSQLTDTEQLPASCKPNRGEEGASLFQINHWIDTSPAPKPSNATTVNAREPLLRRARTCQKQRGLMPNVLAVDFYARGDVFAVVDELNGVR